MLRVKYRIERDNSGDRTRFIVDVPLSADWSEETIKALYNELKGEGIIKGKSFEPERNLVTLDENGRAYKPFSSMDSVYLEIDALTVSTVYSCVFNESLPDIYEGPLSKNEYANCFELIIDIMPPDEMIEERINKIIIAYQDAV